MNPGEQKSQRLVAIAGLLFVTLISGAIAGGYLLYIFNGGQGEPLPNATFDTTQTDEGIVFTHTGGEEVITDNLAVQIGGTQYDDLDGYTDDDVLTSNSELGPFDTNGEEYVAIIYKQGQNSFILYETQIN